MAGTLHATRISHRQLTLSVDLSSNNSFDGGANLLHGFQAGQYNMEHVSAFNAINDYSATAGSVRTVSPKDIFSDVFGSAPGSAPASTALTNMTTPDINESPFLNDSFECSPLYQNDASVSTEWYSLFPEEDKDNTATQAISLSMERTISSQTMERSGSSSTGSPIVLDSSSFRRKSSATNSPAVSGSGVKKSRQRKQLPNIVVDSTDKVAMKRARNTLAARESRQRKFAHVEDLEKRNAELELELEKWKSIAIAQGYTGS
jgi:general control protein GCN4